MLKEENALLAEVGPIKYIAEAIYDKEDPDFIDKAVRVVILVIIVVFDPLAVLLLIAANQTYKSIRTKEEIETPVKKVRKKKILDNAGGPSLESFFKDNDNEIVPKDQIVKMNGDLK